MDTTVIVPAYNEEKTIESVLSTLLSSKLISKIIVVDDGSVDNTLKIMKNIKKSSNKIKIISNKKNIGKGESIKKATKNLKTDIIFFCDADLTGLKPHHILQILDPVIKKKAVMSVGMIDAYGFIGRKIKELLLISGERAIQFDIFKKVIKNPLIIGYGMETILNKYCRKRKLKITAILMRGVNHAHKIKKWNNGFMAYVKEWMQITRVYLK